MDTSTADDLAARILAATLPYEFRSFVLGFARPENYERDAHEAAFRELKVRVGTQLERCWGDRTIDFRRPELRIDVDANGNILLRPAPLFVAGRYRKLSRRIPSSHWIHHRCRGRGCDSCAFTGRLCGPSVQEVVAACALERTGGERSFFHGLGREDTDARMLGRGRPFILEIRSPLRRTLDLAALESDIRACGAGLVEVLCPAVVERSDVTRLKETCAEKTYRAWIEASDPLPADARDRVESLAGATIEQYSPTRIMHRRGRDRLRTRRVVESTWLGSLDGLWVWEVRAAAGTYIKELVSGDDGRTRPSVSEVLGVPARCRHLDVLAVEWTPPWERATTVAAENETWRSSE